MPKRFIKAEKAIASAIHSGKIPKYYYDKYGHRHMSNPYALARHATGYYGTTHDIGLIHPHHRHHVNIMNVTKKHHHKHIKLLGYRY